MKETGLSIHATGDESLGELVSLWRSGHTGGYSREFLAGTICADLGLLRRFVHTAAEGRAASMRTEHPQIQEA